MSFDVTISFDKAEYLDPQLYMMIDTLKRNLPKDTILHVITNRDKDNKIIKYIQKNIPTKLYFKEKDDYLVSRCRYMFNCFDIETDKDWVVKLESDFIVLKNLSILEDILKDEYDLVIEPENRKIFPDNMEKRLWRKIYKAMHIKCPTERITYRENNETGLPLYGTGMVCVKSKHLEIINKRWIPLTKICEKWINLGIHPNETAFSALSFDEKWNTYIYKIYINTIQ